MKLKLLLSLIVLSTICASAQNMFVCSKGTITPYNRQSVGNMTFSNDGTNVTIGGNSYTTSLIDSITFETPSTMKLVGGDISRLTQIEEKSAVYRDSLGNVITPLTFFKQQGWNAIRVSIFVNPTAPSEGVVQTLDYVTKLGKRIKDAGYMFMLDFHYSDYWPDPSKQAIPASWKSDTTATTLQGSLYSYTKRCLQYLVANGATPDLIQTGNEISYGMLWSVGKVHAYSTNNWDVFTGMLKKAIAACREVCPKAKVVIHTERSCDATTSVKYYTLLKQYGVDYDIIGLSYYPFDHGFLPALNTTLTSLESSFPDKKIMIVEYGYFHHYYSGKFDNTSTHPATPTGQKAMTDALTTLLLTHKNVNGLFWWYPEENSSINGWINRGLFNCYDSNKALPALYELQKFK